jgi:AraC-like DNA-binding protein
MGSRLDRIEDWEARARLAEYDVAKLQVTLTITPRRLRQYFQQRFGMCPQCWINRLRLQDALNYLQAGYLTKEAAQSVGLKDASHFCVTASVC